jgi:transcriptional regulator with XRE-family HTH domain
MYFDGRNSVAGRKRERLAERRKAMGLSQERLAEAVGVDASTVARWERGETDPLAVYRPRLAKALSVSLEELGELLTGHRSGPLQRRISRRTALPIRRPRTAWQPRTTPNLSTPGAPSVPWKTWQSF